MENNFKTVASKTITSCGATTNPYDSIEFKLKGTPNNSRDTINVTMLIHKWTACERRRTKAT